jgi:hypothetical protein
LFDLIREVDELLATRPEYLLGRWLKDARRWGANEEERNRLEWNARRVITLWGEQPLIRDYARREWSGMLTGFYLPRWEKFYRALDAVRAGGGEFDAQAFDRELQDWERRWADGRESYPTRPRGDAVRIARRLHAKYGPELAKASEPDVPSLTTGKPARCSTALPGFPASLANDGRARNTDRYWATDVNNDPDPWWQVDLLEATRVGRVVVVGYFGDDRFYGFTVEGTVDGERWEMLADLRGNRLPSGRDGYECRFPPREIRHLRIRPTSNSANTGRHLVEVMAFKE